MYVGLESKTESVCTCRPTYVRIWGRFQVAVKLPEKNPVVLLKNINRAIFVHK